jgi:GT2 family glycosyltransferase
MKEPKVAIIIATFSQDELLQNNLKSLKKMNYKNWKVFLVDDASEKKLGLKMKKSFPWINLLVNTKNMGFSISNNLGMKKSLRKYKPDYILMFNDDCEVLDKNWLNKLINFAEKKENAGIFGCHIVYPDKSLQWYAKKGKTYLSEHPGKSSKDLEILKSQEVNNIMGAVMLIKKKVIDKIGFLDEKFSPFYGEETDFCFRAIKEGFKIFYVGKIKIIHHRNKSISKLTKEDVWFIKKRNSIRLEWKHYGFLKIIYYTLVHFGSIFKRDGISKRLKLKLLFLGYKENFKNKKKLNKREIKGLK